MNLGLSGPTKERWAVVEKARRGRTVVEERLHLLRQLREF